MGHCVIPLYLDQAIFEGICIIYADTCPTNCGSAGERKARNNAFSEQNFCVGVLSVGHHVRLGQTQVSAEASLVI